MHPQQKPKSYKRRDFIRLIGMGGIALPATGLNFPKSSFNEKTSLQGTSRSIHVFSKVLEWLSYEEMAKQTAKIGFDGIDLTVRPRGHVLPENVERDLPKAAEAIRKAGLDVDLITTHILDAEDKASERILKTAYQQGISYYRMGWFRYDQSKSIEKNLQRIRERFKKLAELNAKYNIRGNYQIHANHLYPEGQLFGCTIWDLYHILSEIKSKWIGVQYDIRHATVEATTSWPMGMDLLSPFIQTTVYKDFAWAKDGKAENVPLGEGMVDWDKFLALEERYGLDTPISIHFEYPLGGADKGKEKISVEPDTIFNALRKDLRFAKKCIRKQ